MRKINSFLLLISLLGVNIYSQDTSITNYYPLAIGNSWTYYYINYPQGPIYNYKETVIGTNTMNNHLYYIIMTTFGYPRAPLTENRRIDSATYNIHIYATTNYCPWLVNEITRDSLRARLGDSSKYSCNYYYRCTDTSTVNIFGLTKRKKFFEYSNYFEGAENRTFAKDFGLVSYTTYGVQFMITRTLIGCLVNGIVYGDTSLVGVNTISSEIPEHFSLSQNYPNPFNPITKIKFDIPTPLNPPFNQRGDERSGGGFVRLTIYDVLGQEVTTLLNEQLQPGSYSVDWDASNYPSGVYFYKLETEIYSQTKKMVLIK
jgi:hypothetical protein